MDHSQGLLLGCWERVIFLFSLNSVKMVVGDVISITKNDDINLFINDQNKDTQKWGIMQNCKWSWSPLSET